MCSVCPIRAGAPLNQRRDWLALFAVTAKHEKPRPVPPTAGYVGQKRSIDFVAEQIYTATYAFSLSSFINVSANTHSEDSVCDDRLGNLGGR